MIKSRRKVTLKTMLGLTGIQITNQKLDCKDIEWVSNGKF